MRTAFLGVDVVDKGKEAFRIAVKILQTDVHLDTVPLTGDENRRRMDAGAVAVEVFDIGDNAALEMKTVFGAIPFVLEQDVDVFIEKGQLPHPVLHDLVLKDDGLGENFRIRLEMNGGPGLLAGAYLFEFTCFQAVFIGLPVDFSVALYLGHGSHAQGIDHRNTDTMETAGNLVGGMVELATGMEGGHDQFQGRHIFRRMHIHRNTATVILNRDRIILVDNNAYLRAVACKGLIYGVVDHLVDQMMQTLDTGIADIHGWSFTNSFKPIKNLDLFRTIRSVAYFTHVVPSL